MNTRLIREQELLGDPRYVALMGRYNPETFSEPETAQKWSNDYHDLMMRITIELASPGYTCLRPPGAAGALLVLQDGYKVLGCAEPPVGLTCKEANGCEIEDRHCVRTIHAEVNALLYAARYGYSTSSGVIYSILKPCYQCTKALVAAGIRAVYYAGVAYDEPRTRNIAGWAGMKLIQLEVDLPYGR